MSAEADRARAIRECVEVLATTDLASRTWRMNNAAGALLDAGWVSPVQRNEELRQMAEWQRDARRAFEAIEEVAYRLTTTGISRIALAAQIRQALGDRFRTPEKTT